MPSTVSPSTSRRPGGGGGGGRWWRWRATLTRSNLLTFLVAAMLCSASYYLAIWHSSRGAADGRVLLGPGAAGASWPCGRDAAADADEPLDFETHHSAESAGLSVSSSASAAATTTTIRARRALSGAVA